VSNQDALDAINAFVKSASQQSAAAKDFLTQQAGALATALSQLGEAFAGITFTSDPFFSGITAPDQIAVVTANLNSVGTDLINNSIIEDTGNKINQLFEQTRQATFQLLSVGPDFFFAQMTKNSSAFQAQIATTVEDIAILLAAVVAYNTFAQAMDRTDLNNLTPAKLAQIRSASIAGLTAVNAMNAEAQKSGVVKPSTTTATITAMMGVCNLFANAEATVAFLLAQNVVKVCLTVESDIQSLLTLQASFISSIANTLTAPTIGPLIRTIGSVGTSFGDAVEKFSAMVNAASLDQFTMLQLWVDICQKADVASQLFLKTPEAVKASIQASVHFPSFSGAVGTVTGLGTGPATDFLTLAPLYRQAVLAVLVSDVRPLLATRTADMVTKIGALSAWLAAQAAAMVVLPLVQDALADTATSLADTPALDAVSSFVQGTDFKSLAMADANVASMAGNAADKLGAAIEALPVDQDSKFSALCEIRNQIIAIEATQIIASDAIINETPGAIGDVDTQTQEIEAIQQQAEALLS
jgi:hypothetical protein